ncbi:hypothetical protein CHU98_g1182 [Xylaria longipes]|nr:hypothetical protein CHU98_g1182 [Xylaria longipes]
MTIHGQDGIADTVGDVVVSCEYDKRPSNRQVGDYYLDDTPVTFLVSPASQASKERRQRNGVRVGLGAYAPSMNMSCREAQQLLRDKHGKADQAFSLQTPMFVQLSEPQGQQLSGDFETLIREGVTLNGADDARQRPLLEYYDTASRTRRLMK